MKTSRRMPLVSAAVELRCVRSGAERAHMCGGEKPERRREGVSLKGMYQWAIKTAEGKFHGTTEERDGKLYFNGTVATEAEKNQIWDAIKTIPTWQKDVVADIRVTGGPAASGASASAPASPSSK